VTFRRGEGKNARWGVGGEKITARNRMGFWPNGERETVSPGRKIAESLSQRNQVFTLSRGGSQEGGQVKIWGPKVLAAMDI